MSEHTPLSRRELIAQVAGAASAATLAQGDRDLLFAQSPASAVPGSDRNPRPANAYPWFAAVTQDDIRNVEQDIPEVLQIQDPDIRYRVALVYASFVKESPYRRVSDAPWLVPGKYDLARHSRHAAQLAISMAKVLSDVWGVQVRRDILLAAAVLHDCSAIIENDAQGKKSAIGRTFLHAQLGGVRCYEAGLPMDVASLVSRHPFTPPHIHVTPPNIEAVILAYCDIGAADPLYFIEKTPTHLEIKKRFFELD